MIIYLVLFSGILVKGGCNFTSPSLKSPVKLKLQSPKLKTFFKITMV